VSTLHAGDIATVAVTVAVTTGLMVAVLWRSWAHTPAGISHRLQRHPHPVRVNVQSITANGGWDPSRPIGTGAIFERGVATYTLDDPTTVRLHFEPKNGAPFDRTGPIPERMRIEHPETRRRRRLARRVLALYLAVGLAAFALTVAETGGSIALRQRKGAIVGFVVLAVVWLTTHVVLINRRHISASRGTADTKQPPIRLHHILTWTAALIVIAAALGVAWHLPGGDDPHSTSWAASFFDAAVFVLACTATVVAANHHNYYIHHHD
jgi:hypothetical protein